MGRIADLEMEIKHLFALNTNLQAELARYKRALEIVCKQFSPGAVEFYLQQAEKEV